MIIDESEIIQDDNEELALACLLAEDVVFVNNIKHPDYETDVWCTVVYVNCNDVFAWACADAETIRCSEIVGLYRRFREDRVWGSVKWACVKRNLKPQPAIIRAMKESGVWDEEMELLPENKWS